jgi:hypothetical protein
MDSAGSSDWKSAKAARGISPSRKSLGANKDFQIQLLWPATLVLGFLLKQSLCLSNACEFFNPALVLPSTELQIVLSLSLYNVLTLKIPLNPATLLGLCRVSLSRALGVLTDFFKSSLPS